MIHAKITSKQTSPQILPNVSYNVSVIQKKKKNIMPKQISPGILQDPKADRDSYI